MYFVAIAVCLGTAVYVMYGPDSDFKLHAQLSHISVLSKCCSLTYQTPQVLLF